MEPVSTGTLGAGGGRIWGMYFQAELGRWGRGANFEVLEGGGNVSTLSHFGS